LFRNALSSSLVTISGTGNLASVTFNAPSSGYVFGTATGYCNTNGAAGWLQMSIGTASATPDSNVSEDAWIEKPASSGNEQVPWAVNRVASVAAGAQTWYVVYEVVSAPGWSCAGNLTVFFAPSLLAP
jgi:hypothetical protein